MQMPFWDAKHQLSLAEIKRLASPVVLDSDHNHPPMFFTQELLSRRDSGFGLLWCALSLTRPFNPYLTRRVALQACGDSWA